MQVQAQLTTLDWSIIIVYLAGIIGYGLYLSRGANKPGGPGGLGMNAEDFFLASRASTWPVIGFALLASNISSTTIIGLAGAAYDTGIAVFNYEWMAVVVLVFFSIFFLPFLLRSKIYTLPEFLQKRYSLPARLYFSGLTLFLNVAVDTAAALYGGALMFKLIFPDVPLWQIITVLALSAGLYTMAGGLKAVIHTEVIQAVILLLASAVVATLAIEKVGGFTSLMTSVPPEKLSLIRPLDDPTLPWLGLLTGVPLLGFYFWCTNQFMTQRVLSAKNENHGRWGSLFAGFLKLPLLYLMVFPGTAAILLYPGLEKPDDAYPTLLFSLLPAGLVGIVVAGFLAALMSSIASTFNSASTLFTMDFALRFKPDMSSKQLVFTGRMTTLVFMIAAILWAPQIERFQSLWQYLQAVLAYAVPPVVALYIFGLFWKRANAPGAIACLITGFLGGLFLFVNIVLLEKFDLHFLYVAPILFVASSAVLVVVSLLSAPQPLAKISPLMWTPSFYKAETESLRSQPWWQNYRTLSLVLLILTAMLVFSFR
jgi:solute:Na+ symporter, SSS family